MKQSAKGVELLGRMESYGESKGSRRVRTSGWEPSNVRKLATSVPFDWYVYCFQYHSEVQRFYKALGKRLEKFKLEISKEKTQIIKFTRFETKNNKSFTFLGFEFRWGRSRTGKPLVTMRTSKKKFRAAIAAILTWIKAECSKLGTRAIFAKLRQKLQGHWNYYGVCGNYEMLRQFYQEVCTIMYKWLNRRSQRKSCNWHGFSEMLKHFGVPRPRIIGYWD